MSLWVVFSSWSMKVARYLSQAKISPPIGVKQVSLRLISTAKPVDYQRSQLPKQLRGCRSLERSCGESLSIVSFLSNNMHSSTGRLARMLLLLAMVLVPAPQPLLAQAEKAMAILEKHCVACHGVAKMSGLDLRTRESLMVGGSRGTAVRPGDADASLLYQALTYSDKLQMPPTGRLSSEELESVRLWVSQGAMWPREGAAAKLEGGSWWSFLSPKKPTVPKVSPVDWVRNPIDAFVLQKLSAKGLKPSAPADRRTFLRRLYFDLTGLPPLAGEVEAFLSDGSPTAVEKVVDRLLASPRYGEKWGAYWLDVARYADTGGFETDMQYVNAWRYRDYVIKSFNDDKPYDRFVKEQIAGDEIWADSSEARTGTGFYTIGPRLHESAMIPAKDRSETLSEWADTTSAVFLGLTLECRT